MTSDVPSNDAMGQYSHQFSIIHRELVQIEATGSHFREPNNHFPFPPMIGLGDNRHVVINHKIEAAIARVAETLLDDPACSPLQQFAPLRDRVQTKEWGATVRHAFGPILLDFDLDAEPGPQVVDSMNKLRLALATTFAPKAPIEHAFGCTLFSQSNVSGIQIGPVRFEPREEWLDRKHAEGSISKTNHRRILRNWSGQRLRRRKASLDSISEIDVLDTASGCPYVCSVVTNGLPDRSGREKALLSARIGLAALSLLFERPARALEGMNLICERGPKYQTFLSSRQGGVLLASRKMSSLPHALTADEVDWPAAFEKYRKQISIVGSVLGIYVSPDNLEPRAPLYRTIMLALVWFHEACRESNKQISVVKFASCLDALAGGDRASGIRRLLEKRLNLPPGRSLFSNGMNVHDFVEEIYSRGRNDTLHGTSKHFAQDWSNQAARAESVSRHCLIACLEWAFDNPSAESATALSR